MLGIHLALLILLPVRLGILDEAAKFVALSARFFRIFYVSEERLEFVGIRRWIIPLCSLLNRLRTYSYFWCFQKLMLLGIVRRGEGWRFLPRIMWKLARWETLGNFGMQISEMVLLLQSINGYLGRLVDRLEAVSGLDVVAFEAKFGLL